MFYLNTGSHIKRAVFILVALVVFGGCEKKATTNHPLMEKPLEELTDADIRRMIVVVQTNFGPFKIALYPEGQELTLEFIRLARTGFYDGLTFHEVRPNFWILGGSIDGGPPAQETLDLELFPTPLPNRKGSVGFWHPMLNPQKGGTIFYILLADQPKLNGSYPVFGRVIEGMATVERIGKLPSTPYKGKPRSFMPLTDIIINDLYIEISAE